MQRFYRLRQDKSSRHTGSINAVPKWGLPGASCPVCGITGGVASVQYPGADLSRLPERACFENPKAVPIEEFERLRELVRPLLPQGAPLPPGTDLGPLVGSAQGSFGAFFYDPPFALLARREALDALRAEGVLGLVSHRTELRFRQRKAPEFLELQLEPWGRLHPDCLPRDPRPDCARCGGGGVTFPDAPLLDASSLPSDRDLFRLQDAGTLVASERFVEATRRLGLDGLAFEELPLR
ncbi:double-CXXCG motif protein [Myxococcaceae bacterium GXIMD 01537]